MTKYIFVTGGVVSGLGKGITAASLGRLLKARGLKVAAQKLDPYINVDPGTMSPYQHGEVYVTEDGAETDLDLGHYERFIDEDLNKYSNLTSGRVYWNVLNRERRGEYLGSTVQVIDFMPGQSDTIDKGGTLRLGAYPCKIAPDSLLYECYCQDEIFERHRHRYEVNNDYRAKFMEGGARFAGTAPDDSLVEEMEIPGHRFYLGVQYHPEFKSRPDRAHPIFRKFIASAKG